MRNLLLVFLLLLSLFANAQSACSDPKQRQFDFWVGEWDVYNKAGKLVGHSVIENASGGCLILENWTSANNPYSGKSINFYNKDTDKWEQHWVGSGADIAINPHGEFKNGVMMFTRETKDKDGKPLLNHFSFHDLGQDKVRQHLETSSDNGKTWTTSFDYTYNRKK